MNNLVNDAPALKVADVGFSMGISGTEVAKEASDITLLDDNFLSIEKAILYGRTIMKNIRKFLIFQLTVNVSAVALCFLAPLMGISQPISVLSLLYINLVMDTLAALAFGNEPALDKYMLEKPINRDDSLITKQMASQILSIGGYILVGSLFILFSGWIESTLVPQSANIETYKESIMLAFFMLTIILNGFYARSTTLNCFEKIKSNMTFIYVMIAVLILLFLLIHVVAGVASLTPISAISWCVAFVMALGSVVVDLIVKSIK